MLTNDPDSGKDDYALMAALARGDTAAMEGLYTRYSPMLYALCLRLLGNRAEADELLQDIFLELWAKSSRYDPGRGSPIAYMTQLTRSRGIDRLRLRRMRQKTSEQVELSAASGVPEPPEQSTAALQAERRGLVLRALGQLDPSQREAIACAYYEGLSQSEIATRLNRPLGTVKSQIRQGLIRLRGLLRRNIEENPPDAPRGGQEHGKIQTPP